jgi:hypothetical protein
MSICNAATVIQAAEAIFALLAAAFWYKASVVKVPAKFVAIAPIGGAVISRDLEKLAPALSAQGRLNARAAMCAAVAATLQGGRLHAKLQRSDKTRISAGFVSAVVPQHYSCA